MPVRVVMLFQLPWLVNGAREVAVVGDAGGNGAGEVYADGLAGVGADDLEDDRGGGGPAAGGVVGEGGDGFDADGDVVPGDRVGGGGGFAEVGGAGEILDAGDAVGVGGGGEELDAAADDDLGAGSGGVDGDGGGGVGGGVELGQISGGDRDGGGVGGAPGEGEFLGAVLVEVFEAELMFAGGEADVFEVGLGAVFDRVAGDEEGLAEVEAEAVVALHGELVNVVGGNVEVAFEEEGKIVVPVARGDVHGGGGAGLFGEHFSEVGEKEPS